MIHRSLQLFPHRSNPETQIELVNEWGREKRVYDDDDDDGTCSLGEGTPTALAVEADVVDEALIFVFGPRAFVGVGFLAARGSSHREPEPERGRG